MKRGRSTNRMKAKASMEALLLCEHQVALRLGWSVYLKKSQSPAERARGQALKNGYSGVPVQRRGAAQPEEAGGLAFGSDMQEPTWRQQRSKG